MDAGEGGAPDAGETAETRDAGAAGAASDAGVGTVPYSLALPPAPDDPLYAAAEVQAAAPRRSRCG